MIMKERRIFPRSNINCKISVISDFRILVFNTEVENIGEGGIRVVLREKLGVSTPLDIEIFPADKGMPIKCKGEVIWGNEKVIKEKEHVFDTGVKFTYISEEGKARIRSR
jgi:hypothetical protein